MEQHKQLSIEVDKNLINKVFENVEMRYILLYLYIVRNDMLKNLSDESWLNSFKRLMNLDEILKSDLELYSNKELTEILIDLRIIKNLRSLKELEKKEDDFLIKILEPIRIEENKIIVPENTLFPIISKNFTFLTKRNFHYAISRLKGIMCENSDVNHPFLFEIGKENSRVVKSVLKSMNIPLLRYYTGGETGMRVSFDVSHYKLFVTPTGGNLTIL